MSRKIVRNYWIKVRQFFWKAGFTRQHKLFFATGLAFLTIVFGGVVYSKLPNQKDEELPLTEQVTGLQSNSTPESTEIPISAKQDQNVIATPTPVSQPSSYSPTPLPLQGETLESKTGVSQTPTPISTRTEGGSSSSDTDAYLDYLHQLQEESARKIELCSQWANERGVALEPFEQNADEAYQKYQDEIIAIDNLVMSAPQKEQRKAAVLPTLMEVYNEANQAYWDAFYSYGSCPY